MPAVTEPPNQRIARDRGSLWSGVRLRHSGCIVSFDSASRTSRKLVSALRKSEYVRPWKLCSLAVGIGLLIAGAFYYEAPDWDVPISLLMAGLTYLTAPWSMRVILGRRWKHWPAMLVATWFTVDGIYWLYWRFKDPWALEMMREANFPASLSLYWICGVIWLYRGSLSELLEETKRALRGSRAPTA